MRYLDFESEFESRFPLQEVKVSEKSEIFLFYVSCPKVGEKALWQGFALQTEQNKRQKTNKKNDKNRSFICD